MERSERKALRKGTPAEITENMVQKFAIFKIVSFSFVPQAVGEARDTRRLTAWAEMGCGSSHGRGDEKLDYPTRVCSARALLLRLMTVP